MALSVLGDPLVMTFRTEDADRFDDTGTSAPVFILRSPLQTYPGMRAEVYVRNVAIPYTFTQLRLGVNSHLHWYSSNTGVFHDYDFPDGNYSIDQFLTLLNAYIPTIHPGFSWILIPGQNRVQLATAPAGQFIDFHFEPGNPGNIRRMLGADAILYHFGFFGLPVGFIFPNIVNMISVRGVNILTSLPLDSSGQYDAAPSTFAPALGRAPIDVPYWSLLTRCDTTTSIIMAADIDTISMRLSDSQSRLLDMHGSNWSITLVLRQRPLPSIPSLTISSLLDDSAMAFQIHSTTEENIALLRPNYNIPGTTNIDLDQAIQDARPTMDEGNDTAEARDIAGLPPAAIPQHAAEGLPPAADDQEAYELAGLIPDETADEPPPPANNAAPEEEDEQEAERIAGVENEAHPIAPLFSAYGGIDGRPHTG